MGCGGWRATAATAMAWPATAADAVGSSEEEALQLVDCLVEGNCLELLVTRLGQMNEKAEDEAKAIFNALSIVENLVEVGEGRV